MSALPEHHPVPELANGDKSKHLESNFQIMLVKRDLMMGELTALLPCALTTVDRPKKAPPTMGDKFQP